MPASKRFMTILLLVAVAALGLVVFQILEDRAHEQPLPADFRAPVANPPVDPNRPDLFEEPAHP
jgi:hypothetical protein